ncbi:hypothetical protein ACQUY5_31510 [Bacillus cereus]|uniref:hypothetical protein n=1 Tax=Bacillus cereus TaxID=1396 RepID=UPI003D17FBB1
MNFDERLLQSENKGYISVISDDSNGVSSFFIKQCDIKVGDIVKDPLGNEYEVMVKVSNSRVLAERL